MTASNTKKQKLVCGVGITDDYIMEDGVVSKSYKTWVSILSRCYKNYVHKITPTYIGCEVCEEWKIYSNFKKWFDENYVEDFFLDKDLKNPGNKIYSPENCEFIPNQLKSILKKSKSKTKTGFRGVHLRSDGVYISLITIDGKTKSLGSFRTAIEAFNAYKVKKESIIRSAAMKYFFTDNVISYDMFEALMKYKVKP